MCIRDSLGIEVPGNSKGQATLACSGRPDYGHQALHSLTDNKKDPDENAAVLLLMGIPPGHLVLTLQVIREVDVFRFLYHGNELP